MTSTRTVAASACVGDVAQRLACDAVDERVGGRPAAARSSTCSSVSMPCACSGLSRSSQRGLEPGGLQARRVDLDEQRAQVAHALAQPARSLSRSAAASCVGAAALALVGERREAERDAGEVLDDAVVQVGGDPAALVVGGLDRARRAARSRSAVAALQAPGERPGERDLDEQQDEQRRRSAAARARASSRRAVALTELKRW